MFASLSQLFLETIYANYFFPFRATFSFTYSWLSLFSSLFLTFYFRYSQSKRNTYTLYFSFLILQVPYSFYQIQVGSIKSFFKKQLEMNLLYLLVFLEFPNSTIISLIDMPFQEIRKYFLVISKSNNVLMITKEKEKHLKEIIQ